MKKAVIGSLFLSILHSIFFFGQDLGISVLLFAVVSVFLLIAFLKKTNQIKNKSAVYLSIPILLLSSTYCIFNNEFFWTLNIFIIPLLLGCMIVWACVDTIKLRSLIGKSINLIIGSLEFIPNGCRLIKEAFRMKPGEKEAKNNKMKLIGIGLLCSLPILFIVLGLLIATDGVFATLFENLFNQIMFIFTSDFIVDLITRLFLILVVFVYLVCIIYNIFHKDSAFNRDNKVKDLFKLHIDHTIINTILTVINIVYLIFTGIQIVYLYSYAFSNATLIANLNLAQYARQGFFQLMFITVINFALILITNANEEKQERNNQYTKWMNVLMCVFTIIIAISAAMRMHLYEREFGYTFLRLIVYFILITEIIAVLPTIYYILKRKINLLKYYITITVSMYILLNFINLDYVIARNNITRAEKMPNEYVRQIDITYLTTSLGTDAVPELVRLYQTIQNEQDKRRLNNYLYNIYNDVKEDRNFQEWNLSKAKAKKILEPLNLKYQAYNSKQDKRYQNNYDIDPSFNSRHL